MINSDALYIYISPRVIDLLVYHLDLKVESIDESVDRHCHLDSHARPPSPSPARACLPRTRPWSRSRPAPAVSPCVPVPRRTPNAARAHAFCACACGSAIFWYFAVRSTIFAIMTQSFFDLVSHFWVLVHSLSMTQSFFRFHQPFFEISSRAQPFLLQWVSHFLDFIVPWVSHFFIYHPSFDVHTMAQSFFRFCQPFFWDFIARSAIFAIMPQSFFDFISYFWVFVHALSVTRSFFRFRHALSHFCYNGSLIF
jgi:hypothetical protein